MTAISFKRNDFFWEFAHVPYFMMFDVISYLTAFLWIVFSIWLHICGFNAPKPVKIYVTQAIQ